MVIASVAIGNQYEKESMRLLKSFDGNVYVFTKSDPQYKIINEDRLIDALYHKSNFANYLKPTEDSVLFCDADLFSLTKNPLETFSVNYDTDFAYVPYSGKWHMPDKKRQDAFDYLGHKLNSGFLYFRTYEIAINICNGWAKEYLERERIYTLEKGASKYEYDEWALMISLINTDYKIETLDKKWNDWELSSEEEIRNSNSICFQSHDHLDII